MAVVTGPMRMIHCPRAPCPGGGRTPPTAVAVAPWTTIDTRIAATGYPLSTVELLKLKLASAILARPRVLVLTRLFDLIEADDLATALAAMREQAFTTVIYFSSREAALGCDRFLHMEARQQRWFDSFADFAEARRQGRSIPAGAVDGGDRS